MDKLRLSSKEIIFLSAIVGASEIQGIPDGFYGMDKFEIKKELLKLQDLLESKNYATSDFYGNFNPDEKVLDIIQICSLCDKYIVIDKVSFNEKPIKLAFYFKGNKSIKSVQVEEEYELSYINSSEVFDLISGSITWISNNDLNFSKVAIPDDVLKNVQNKLDNFEETKECELSKLGLNNNEIKIIHNGLFGNSNYYSIVMEDLRAKEDNKIFSIMVINSKEGSAELIPVVESKIENSIEFQPIDIDKFNNKIKNFINMLEIC